MDDNKYAAALSAAQRGIGKATDLEQALQYIVQTVKTSLPGFDEVGISTVQNGHVETRAATGQLVWDLDKLQYELAEGPCVDAMFDAPMVQAPHIRHDQRWPNYVPRAVELGLKSQLAVKLYTDEDGTIGGLNIYSTTSETIDVQAPGTADLFAAHAAVVLGKIREIDSLHEGLSSRTTIGKAVGLLMAKYDLDDDHAFAFLVRTSSHANLKVRDIALKMVEDHNAEGRARRQ
jgi:transcriptional regulator with GAF, ATPase, and Fis domain